MAESLTDIIRQRAYYEGGGKPEGGRDIDKINAVFKTIAGFGGKLSQIAKDRIEAAKTQRETQKAIRSAQPISDRFPSLPEGVPKEMGALPLEEAEQMSKIIENMREKPSAAELQPFTATKEHEMATGGRIKAGQPTTRFEVRQLGALYRVEVGKEAGISATAVKSLNEYSPKALTGLAGLKKIELAARDMGDFSRGLLPQLYAKGMTKYEEYSAEPKVSNYISSVKGEIIQLARNLAEEKGPITTSDVEMLEAGLTGAQGITTPLEDKLKIIETFKNKVRLAIIDKMATAGITPAEFKKQHPDLHGFAFGDEQKTTPTRTTYGTNRAFNTIQEAEAANLPKGTVITIGGRRAVIE